MENLSELVSDVLRTRFSRWVFAAGAPPPPPRLPWQREKDNPAERPLNPALPAKQFDAPLLLHPTRPASWRLEEQEHARTSHFMGTGKTR